MFEVGDKVKIKENLIIGNYYGGLVLKADMAKERGKISTICSTKEGYVDRISLMDYAKAYKLAGVERWFWTEEMLEPINKQVEFICENNSNEFKNKLNKATVNRKVKDIKYSATAIPELGRYDANWEYSAIIIFDE